MATRASRPPLFSVNLTPFLPCRALYSRHIKSSSASRRASLARPSDASASSSDESSYFPRAPARLSTSPRSSSESREASMPGAAAACTAFKPPLLLIRASENRSISDAPVAPSSSWPTKPSAVRMRSLARSFAFFFLSRRARASTPCCNSAISSRIFSSESDASADASPRVSSSSSSSSSAAATPPRSAALRLPSSPRDLRTARRHLSRFLKSTRPSTPRSAHSERISGVVAGCASRSMNPSLGGTTPFLFCGCIFFWLFVRKVKSQREGVKKGVREKNAFCVGDVSRSRASRGGGPGARARKPR